MTGMVWIVLCAALLYFEVSYRRFRREVLQALGGKREVPHGKLRHYSPHRTAIDEKRRTNQ